jgi:alpha-D-ribose 1-methylphosphonate 5-triphosphate diphosphatase
MNQPRQHQAISISNATVVTPDAVLSPGFVRIEDGRFLEVQAKTGPHGGPDVCNARGALLLLGLLDIHAEALEAAIAPRPSAPFDPAFVLPSYDAHLVACGITTVFHFVGLADLGEAAKPLRTREKALAILVSLRAFVPMPGSAASSI